jgi:WD40 repeat protein
MNARLNVGVDPQRVLLLLKEAQRLGPVDHFGEVMDEWARDPCRAVLRGHKGSVRTAAFSADGQRVVTASSDGTARVWDASSGKSLATLSGHTKAVNAAAFSVDGQRVVTASSDGTARIWPSWRWNPEALARLDVGRELTPDERREYLYE